MDLAVFSLLIFVSSFMPSIQSPESPAPNVTDLTFKNIDFAMNLYLKIASRHDDNIFFSPLSVSTAFAALSLAARNSTRSEILSGLNLDTLEQAGQLELIPQLFQHLQRNISQAGTLKLEQGTALFVDLNFQIEKDFGDQMKLFFSADVENVDFKKSETSKIINDHVMEKTGGKVKEMVTSLDPLTRLLLINTVFFQGG